MWRLVITLLTVALGFATECTWMCDDPVGHSVCEPRCLDPVCVYDVPCGDLEPDVEIRCDTTDVVVTESCPMCETIAKPIHPECEPNKILCEAPQCGWECRKAPLLYPNYPRCELQCQQPACGFENLGSSGVRFKLF